MNEMYILTFKTTSISKIIIISMLKNKNQYHMHIHVMPKII